MKRYESLVLVLAGNLQCLLNLLPKFNLGVKYKPGNQELVDKNFKIIFYTFEVSFISKMKQQTHDKLNVWRTRKNPSPRWGSDFFRVLQTCNLSCVSFISFSFIHDPTSSRTFTLLGLNKDYCCYYITHNGKTLFKNINMNNNTINHLQG